jgi:hypothetical protein
MHLRARGYGEKVIETEPEGRAGAQRHQQIHCPGQRFQGLPGADIEIPADRELHDRRNAQLPQPRQSEIHAHDMPEHRQDQRQRQQGRRQHDQHFPPVGGGRALIVRRAFVGNGGAVARILDYFYKIGGGHAGH